MLGARIPLELKEMLNKYCLGHGIKISYFVSQVIREKLQEIAEDNLDQRIAEERLKSPNFVSEKEFRGYLNKRGIKA
jgi:predicted DNA-binding protein